MITVEEINKTFSEKGLHVELPLPPDQVLTGLEILEKRIEGENIKLLLNVRFIGEGGREASDIIFCQGKTKIRKEKKVVPAVLEPLKSQMLRRREKNVFENEAEAETYLREAISHLLQDKGYHPIEREDVELYMEKEGRGFFINLAARCDDKAVEKARVLVELRRKHGSSHDYGLIVPAFQESLGLPLHLQERWVYTNEEYLSAHRVGIYAVDNLDPNRIYPWTIYPGVKELMRYFMITTQQWSLIRSRYVLDRARKRDSQV